MGMGIDLNVTPQTEDEGLNLELSLAPPSSSSSPPHHKPKRSKSVKFPSICHQEPANIHELAPLQLSLFLDPSQPGPLLAPSQLNSSQWEPLLQPWPSQQGLSQLPGPSQPEPLQPWPSREGSLQGPGPSQPSSFQPDQPLQPRPSQEGSSQLLVPMPPLNQRQHKRIGNDISTTNHQEQATTKERRQRTKADEREIDPPYPWSTNRRAKIHTMEYLRSKNIVTIRGEVECSQCKEKYEMEYDLVSKFEEVARFVARNGEDCNDRAPSSWATPVALNCRMCNQEKCVEAVIPKSDFKTINWLFLLLGQMLGNLQLDQLRYFCTHTNNHRTGAKDRLLYQTYITLCQQLNA